MKAGSGATATWKAITWQSLPVLLGAVVIGVLAGQLLELARDDLFKIPILLALVPAVNGVGGNVGSLMGSRVASGIHMGGIWSNRARGFRRDVIASVILAAVTFAFLGAFASAAGPLLGIEVDVSVWRLALTTLGAGLALVASMIVLVIVVGMLSHRHGWDPDNVVVPVLTTAGDTLGILFLLLAGGLIL